MIRNRILVSIVIVVLMCLAACSSPQEIQPSASVDAVNTETVQIVEDAVKPQIEPTASVEESSEPTPSVIKPINDEGNVRYTISSSDKERTLGTFDELNEISDFIITGVCMSSEPIFQNDTLYTLSEVKTNTIYRGEKLAAGDTILIIEMDGRTTFGEYIKNCNIEKKAFETGETLPPDYQMVTGVDGFFPLKEGEQVLLFLADSTGFIKSIEQQVFGIWGGYDGKLFLQPNGATYARPLPSKNDQLIFGEGTLKITVDELKEEIGKEKPAAK